MLSDIRKYIIIKKAAEDYYGTAVPASFKSWFKPFAHQIDAIERLIDNKGKLILAHQMGTGKTVTSIYGFEVLKDRGEAKKALIVVPAGLRENFARQGLEKFLKDPKFQIIGTTGEKSRKNYVRPNTLSKEKDYTIVSYAMFRRDPEGLMKSTGADTLIFDEFHKARNEASGVFAAAIKARQYATNFMGLTASLVSNSPGEIASLVTISQNKRYGSPKQFRRDFTKVVGQEPGLGKTPKKVRDIQRHGQLVKFVDPKVHYVSTGSLKGKTMPRKDVSFVDVTMSSEQHKLYQLALDKLGPRAKEILQGDPDVIARTSKHFFAQTLHARQISNSVHMGKRMSLAKASRESPKVNKLLSDTEEHLNKTPDGKVVVYSNLIRGGVDVLAAGLKDRGIPFSVFVGKGTEISGNKITSQVRDLGINRFRKGEKKVLILSGAGAEGLNLPNATAFYALDGHFNPEKILQAEGRVRRLGGQAHRVAEKRVVDVKRYRNVAPKPAERGWLAKKLKGPAPGPAKTTDQWMYDTAKRKYTQNKQIYTTLEKPHKYIRKYRASDGSIRYEYPKKKKGFFKSVLG